ncbi:MAG: hypothetical protein QMD01_06310 [Thermodesulfovibrionales bacterium]|nr:hypothetical protein [Thermodesulfovibrionales bacterium]
MRTEDRLQKIDHREQSTEKKGLSSIFCLLISVLCLLIFTLFCNIANAEEKQPLQFGKDTQIQHIKPKKPVKIKLHRNAKGDYSWDLTGDSVDEVVQADKRLRKLLKVE